jgi:hypothetical protein
MRYQLRIKPWEVLVTDALFRALTAHLFLKTVYRSKKYRKINEKRLYIKTLGVFNVNLSASTKRTLT